MGGDRGEVTLWQGWGRAEHIDQLSKPQCTEPSVDMASRRVYAVRSGRSDKPKGSANRGAHISKL